MRRGWTGTAPTFRTCGSSELLRAYAGSAYLTCGLGSGSNHNGCHHRRLLQRLEHHAIALRQLDQRVNLFGRRVGVQVDRQTNFLEADVGVLGHAEGAAEIEIAFGAERAAADGNAHGSGDGSERHSRAADE